MQTNSVNSNQMIDRAIRAARLDPALYKEVESDTSANSQALTVVLLAAAAAGIGAFLKALFTGNNFFGSVIGLVFGVIGAVIGYYLWSYVIHYVGTKIFKGDASVDEVLRTLGFAYGPRALGIFAFIPVLGGLVSAIGAIWWLVTSYYAVREALDLDNANTIVTIIVGAIAIIILYAILGIILGIFGLGAALLFSL